jgi:chromosome segregation ATPase
LHARDEAAGAALAAVEELQSVVDALRARAVALGSFLAALPAQRERYAAAVTEAEQQLAAAEATLADARRELERAEQRGREQERTRAARAFDDAEADTRIAQGELTRARDNVVALEAEADQAGAEADALDREAHDLARRLAALPRLAPEATVPPGPAPEGVDTWAARAHGALLPLYATLVAERDAIVREANELGSSVLGEALGATSVAGVRERVARALGSTPP